MKLRQIICDICGSSNAELVGKPPIEGRLRTRFPQLSETRVVRCTNCGFYFVNPTPFFSGGELEFIYDQTYFEASVMTDWWRKRRVRDRINRLDAIEHMTLPRVRKLLDVGCGEGWVLREGQRRGWEVWGVDVSNNLAEPLKSEFGERLVIGELAEAGFASESFDAIYMDSVLEHVRSPTSVMRECYRILRRGGCLYVGVPNEDSLMNEVKRLLYSARGHGASSRLNPFRNPYHIVGFNKDCFTKMAEKLRFRVEKMRIFGGHYEFLKYRSSGTVFAKSLFHSIIHAAGLLLGKGFYIEA